MTSFILVAPCARRWMQSIRSAVPRVFSLLYLVDRGHRELPIRPDYIGKNLPTATREQIQVRLQETDNKPDGVYLEKQ